MSQTHAIACSQSPSVHYFGYLVRFHPTPLRLQEVLAMHSIMLSIGSVGQMKLESAIRV